MIFLKWLKVSRTKYFIVKFYELKTIFKINLMYSTAFLALNYSIHKNSLLLRTLGLFYNILKAFFFKYNYKLNCRTCIYE